MLAADEKRCLGQLPAPMGEIPCMKRQTCARYLQRHDGAGAPVAMWLCPTPDHYYGNYVQAEVRA